MGGAPVYPPAKSIILDDRIDGISHRDDCLLEDAGESETMDTTRCVSNVCWANFAVKRLGRIVGMDAAEFLASFHERSYRLLRRISNDA